MKTDSTIAVGRNITKVSLVRALSEGLFRVALGYDEYDSPIMVSKATPANDKIDIECTDGTKFEIKLSM